MSPKQLPKTIASGRVVIYRRVSSPEALAPRHRAATAGTRPKQVKPSHLTRRAAVYVRHAVAQDGRTPTGSQRYQGDPQDLAQRWGWPQNHIEVIEDIGRSGAHGSERPGFVELRRLVATGQVGIVLVTDPSRLSRSVAELRDFRMLCRRTNTLVAIGEQLWGASTDHAVFPRAIREAMDTYERRQRHIANRRNGLAAKPRKVAAMQRRTPRS